MSKPYKDGVARNLPPDLLQQIEKSLKQVKKEHVVYRRNERPPLMTMTSPARGRLTSHGIRLVGDLAAKWNLNSGFPQALKAYDSGVAGFLLFLPVETWDPNALDQYEINWSKGKRRASIDLRAIMQPRNLEVDPGYVSEIPVSVQQLPSGQHYLFLHIGEARLRAEAEIGADEQELVGETPAEQAAPSTEE